ncbi:WhiB family transcriptional regulator [Isoptericola sp. NPDC057191]|uniref:WhiB family transcriptional regulator n=1 Tax=Isoptericola sp. NPDC057191 TaxID=3346041 RepID=UPI00363ED487
MSVGQRAWREHATCAGWDIDRTDPWFPAEPGRPDAYALAKSLCDGCPVLDECFREVMALEAGTSKYYREGVYAGLDPDERARLDHSGRRRRRGPRWNR